MTEHLRQTIRALQQELEALDQQRGDLEAAIRALQRLNGADGAPAEPRPVASPRTPSTRGGARTKSGADAGVGDRIVAALRERSPQAPGELAKAAKVKLKAYALKKLLSSLHDEGRIVRSGNGRGARIALPGKTPAKEAVQRRRGR